MRPAKCIILILVISFLAASPCRALDLPCWNKPSCFSGFTGEPKFGLGFVDVNPRWYKSLDDISPRMRQDADYSILFNSQKDRIPYIHTAESQRAVDEFAGDVISSVVSPLTYRLPLYPDFTARRDKINNAISGAMPEIKNDYYSVHILPRVDFSRTNPVSLGIKVRDGEELGDISLRIHETEAMVHVYKGVVAVGGYSFRDSSWYTYVAGKIPLPW